MTNIFLYGTLCDPDLLSTVLGRDVMREQARLPDHKVSWAKNQNFPLISKDESATADGILLSNLTDTDIDRLNFYEGPYAYDLYPCEVQTKDGVKAAQIYMPEPDVWTPGASWDLSEWQREFGPLLREAAVEIMAYFGDLSAEQVADRMPMIRARAQAQLYAKQHPATVKLRSGLGDGDVIVDEHKRTYSEFFALDDLKLRYRQFSGAMGEVVDRAVFVAADAVTVLPYDPQRDRVLLIEQFRAPLFRRGDATPWSLEAIAGRVDPLETHEQTAHREAMEEAGIELGKLHKVAGYYPSPGANTEYLTSFIGIADLPDGSDGVGGLDIEAEDIRSIVVPFDTLMEAVDSGEAGNSPLILSAFWLAANRQRLRNSG